MIKMIKYDEKEGKLIVDGLLSRTQLDQSEVQMKVDKIISEVRLKKDKALFEYTKMFDGFEINKENILVSKEEIEKAYKEVDKELIEIIKKAAERIRDFHEKQKLNSWLEPKANGETLGQLVRPLKRVGVYVPGGKASYPSSVLMNVIPAKVAGVSEIIMTTPPDKKREN